MSASLDPKDIAELLELNDELFRALRSTHTALLIFHNDYTEHGAKAALAKYEKWRELRVERKER